MLFASLINHHAAHQIQVPHGNFISYGEKTERGRVTFFFFLIGACENCWPAWDPYYFHGLAVHDWHT